MASVTPLASAASRLEWLIACPIEQSQMVNPYRIVPCGHTFELASIQESMKRSNYCPLDKYKIDSLVPDTDLKVTIEEIGNVNLDSELSEKQLEAFEQRILASRGQAFAAVKELRAKEIAALEKGLEAHLEMGLYVLGICQEIGCADLHQPLWINKGTGKFGASEFCETACHTCKTFFDVDSVAIRSFNYSWEGRKATGESCTGSNALKSRVEIIPKLSEWRYLTINVDADKEVHPANDMNSTKRSSSLEIESVRQVENGSYSQAVWLITSVFQMGTSGIFGFYSWPPTKSF